MRKNCTFRIWWNPLTAIFCLFRSLYLGVTQYHRRVSEAQAWLSSKNDVKLETTHKKTTPTGERCNFLRTVSTRGLRCQWTEHWVRCIAIDVLSSYGFFFQRIRWIWYRPWLWQRARNNGQTLNECWLLSANRPLTIRLSATMEPHYCPLPAVRSSNGMSSMASANAIVLQCIRIGE